MLQEAGASSEVWEQRKKIFSSAIMKWFVFLYNLHKTEETLLHVMKMHVLYERIKDPTD
jgi:hypothetical protein